MFIQFIFHFFIYFPIIFMDLFPDLPMFLVKCWIRRHYLAQIIEVARSFENRADTGTETPAGTQQLELETVETLRFNIFAMLKLFIVIWSSNLRNLLRNIAQKISEREDCLRIFQNWKVSIPLTIRQYNDKKTSFDSWQFFWVIPSHFEGWECAHRASRCRDSHEKTCRISVDKFSLKQN